MVHVVATWLVLKHTLLEIESLVTLSMGPKCTCTGTFESTGAKPRGLHVVAMWLVLKHKLLEIESLVTLSMGPTCTCTGTFESTGAKPRGPGGRHVAFPKT